MNKKILLSQLTSSQLQSVVNLMQTNMNITYSIYYMKTKVKLLIKILLGLTKFITNLSISCQQSFVLNWIKMLWDSNLLGQLIFYGSDFCHNKNHLRKQMEAFFPTAI
jgi:hypothetical protein